MTKSRLEDKLALVVLGRSGSGKGTQARFLLARLKKRGVFHMETGRFLRAALERDNPTTRMARLNIMKKGGIFPTWFAAFTWLKELIEGGHADEHLVFDGAARRMFEAKLLDDVMAWHKRPLPLCIYIDVSRREAMRRLLARGRSDDTKEAVKNRLDYFPREVMPVIRYYSSRGRMIRVDGSPAPEEVFAQINAALAEKLGTGWPQRA